MDENEWIKIKNAHPAIISRDDYEATQRTLAIDTRTAPRHSRVHIFSGMLICGSCGGNMIRKTVPYKDISNIYYCCSNGKRNGCSSPFGLNESDLVSVVTRKIRERIADIERLNACVSKSFIQELMQREYHQQITVCDMKIRDLHRYKLHLHNSRADGFLNDFEYQEFHSFYDSKIAHLEAESAMLWKESHFFDTPVEDKFEWVQCFLQFSRMKELDRFAVVKMVRSIRVLATKEIIIDFAYQAEFERLIRYSELGGHANGEKEPKRE